MGESVISAPSAPSSGSIADGIHRMLVRIYYEDTDFSGVVYHANYLKFMERGRTEFLRLSGIHHADLRDGKMGEPMFFAIAHMEIDFKRPAQIDDVLEIVSWITSVKGASFSIDQEIFRASDLLVTAHMRAAVINEAGRPCRLSDTHRAYFKTVMNAANKRSD